MPDNHQITVIFISDGRDDRTSSLEKRMNESLKGNKRLRINFLCLGVGKNFPTFISMKLREKYHNGERADSGDISLSST